MKIALDANVLADAEGTKGAPKRDKALALIQRWPPLAVVIPAQTLGELFSVLVRASARSGARWRRLSYRDACSALKRRPP